VARSAPTRAVRQRLAPPGSVVEPLDFLEELKDLSAADQQKIMSSNLKGLLEGVRD